MDAIFRFANKMFRIIISAARFRFSLYRWIVDGFVQLITCIETRNRLTTQ